MRIGNLLLCGIVMVGTAYAETTPADRKTVSSKAYVDTEVGLKQPKIPAANINNTTVGVSVVTYTDNEGVIGERQIYDGSSNYTNGDANKLVTAAALNGTVTNLPTMETSKLSCANQACDLWTIVDQQVYGQNSSNNNSNSGSNNNGSGTD